MNPLGRAAINAALMGLITFSSLILAHSEEITVPVIVACSISAVLSFSVELKKYMDSETTTGGKVRRRRSWIYAVGFI